MRERLPGPQHGAAIAGALLVLLALWVPRAASSQHRWLVAPDDDVGGWREAVASIWPAGEVVVEPWVGTWPPACSEAGGAHSFVVAEVGFAALCVRDGRGNEVMLPVNIGRREPAEARVAVLLILRGIVSPLAIADRGWMPRIDPDEAVASLPDEPAPEGTSSVPSPLSVVVAVGASGRPGLDTPAVALALSPAWLLTPRRPLAVHVTVDLAADVRGRVAVGEVPAQLDALLLATGVALQPSVRRTTVDLGLTGGVRIHGVRRLDHGGAPTLTEQRPALRLTGGASWPVGGDARFGLLVAWTLDLVAASPAIRLQLGSDGVDFAGWSLAVQAFVRFPARGAGRAS